MSVTRFLRLGAEGAEQPAIELDDGTVRDLRSVTRDIDGAFLVAGGLIHARRIASSLPILDNTPRVRVGSPIARPQAVVCIGQNYAAHAAESVDWEIELGVVIGRRARYIVSEGVALDYIAGLRVSHDVSERHAQLEISGGQ